MPDNNIPKKKNTKKARVIIIIVIALLLGVLGFSLWQFFSVYIPQQREQNRFAELRSLISEPVNEPEDSTEDGSSKPTESKLPGYDTLFKMNHDLRGWLKIPDTVIDYPVMKNEAENGEYYLHRDFDGYYSFAGCLFIGQNCDEDSDMFVIYGHNMLNGSMFGDLDLYSYSDYAQEHRDIIFDTADERRVYRVFAAFHTQVYDKSSDAFKYYETIGDFDEEGYAEAVENFCALSQIDIGTAPEYPAQIMMLSTCAYHTDDGRFVVAAYRIS